jgi:hypothetical protein
MDYKDEFGNYYNQVQESDLKKGDIVYFKNPENGLIDYWHQYRYMGPGEYEARIGLRVIKHSGPAFEIPGRNRRVV